MSLNFLFGLSLCFYVLLELFGCCISIYMCLRFMSLVCALCVFCAYYLCCMDIIFTLSSFLILFVNDKVGEELFVYCMHAFL